MRAPRAMLGLALAGGFIQAAAATGLPGGDDAAMLAALPSRIATLQRQAPMQPRPDPGRAAILAFGRPGVTAAVTLSGRGATQVPDGPTSVAARGALAQATADASLRLLEDAARLAGNRRRPTELRWRSFIIHDGSTTDILCHRAALPMARRLVTEIVCATGVGGRMMTIGLTLTHDRKGEQEAIRLACRFVAATQALLRDAAPRQRT